MLSVLSLARKSLGWLAGGLGLMSLAACDPMATTGGPRVGAGETVQVALLVPSGSGQASDEFLAKSLENAARLAMADLGGNAIDLRVYSTAGQPSQAAAAATKAVAEGAKVILGPLYAQEANAAGLAVASSGVSVLSFSNNASIAGGNVFVLGQTFTNTAERLANYAVGQGKSRFMVLHDRTAAGDVGRAAIEQGVRASGGSVVNVTGYEFSQNGLVAAVPGIAATARTGADALFLTADTAGALPLLTQLLRDNGIDPAVTQLIGLTRWDIPPETISLPGVQGGWFALPDPGLYQQFVQRYSSAYGSAPPPVAGLAYDGIAAIGALARQGGAISPAALTQNSGFAGVTGIFRLRSDGTNQRGLAVAQIRNNQVVVIDPAPRSFGGAGS
ncbi:MAG: penicillin-binding protein activator [Cereibacter sphaeroides]|uniref:Penicillin-binding protein activator n=1 Tax=Cereibacter sphaeroides TaxID=1063 RepID=A0A2W5UAP6_CERSP|nr:MAG: penicillin-binding protein activator [Cereibacter sphaeroides]